MTDCRSTGSWLHETVNSAWTNQPLPEIPQTSQWSSHLSPFVSSPMRVDRSESGAMDCKMTAAQGGQTLVLSVLWCELDIVR